MLTFDFFDARHGDAFLVRGEDPFSTILVDGGPSGVYEASLKSDLLRSLDRDHNGVPRIDAICLSHVDDDHAAGILRLLLDIHRNRNDKNDEPFVVKRLWFNSVERLVEEVAPGVVARVEPLHDAVKRDQAVVASYAQGWAIRNEASFLGLSGNKPFNEGLTTGREAEVGDVRVRVVAPGHGALEKLASVWREAEKKKDPKVITAAYLDRKIPNLSSIVLLVDSGGRSALLTGDARGDEILRGLDTIGATTDSRLKVDLLKLPHHGSDKNIADDFFQTIHADHYVISASGKHGHPCAETLGSLVKSRAKGDKYTVHLTNDIDFAVRRLRELQVGRAFDVSIRGVEPSLQIVLD